MKPAPFEYAAPRSIDEATALLSEHGDDAKVLAGGQSLVPLLGLRLARPAVLVDVNRVAGLTGISRENGVVRIGAGTRHATVEHDSSIAADLPLLAIAAPLIGHFQIRNRGTLGGSLAHADPSAEWPAVAVALDAELEIARAGQTRRVPARDFFVSTFVTALEAEDLLVAVRFPVWGSGSGFAIEELARRNGDFAVAGAICAVRLDGDVIGQAAVALLGMSDTPVRATDVEQQLTGSSPDSLDLEHLGSAAVASLAPPDDIHATGTYRKRIGSALVSRALARAIKEAHRG
jgi:carbon-monoxide dehydrogenase medium subunit